MTIESNAPWEEPPGAESRAGFVKRNPLNNSHYLAQYTEWPFHSILIWLDEELERLIPGYNISQIKMKFNELRFYFDYPAEIPVQEQWPAYDSEEKIKAMVRNKITYAEGYVSGYLAAERARND